MKKHFKFRSIINDIPIKSKFILIYVVGVMLPIIIINIAFLDRMTGIIKEREDQNLKISLERARKDIHDFIDGGVAVSHALYADKPLYETLDKTYESRIDFYEAFDERLRSRVTSYIPVNNQIQSITIFTENETIMPGGNYQVLNAISKNSEWYRLWKSSTAPVMVAAYQAAQVNDSALNVPYLSVIEKMDNFDTYGEYSKVLRIDIDLSKIYDVILRERDYLNLYLVNEHNQIIMSTGSGYRQPAADAYPVFQLPQSEQDKAVYIVPIGTASYVKGWKLVGVPQGIRLSSATREMQLHVGFIAIITTLFSLVFIYIMLQSYNYRVKRLSRHMQKVGNEKFDLIQIDEGRDEIGGLIRNFNMMTAQINSLINNVYKLEIQKKNLETERVRAELNFLQSQMNPHFLFNTLNAIMVVCTINNYSDVKEIIKYLSKLLRRLLSWKEDIVTLEEELMFLEMYLKIEKFRFRDKFEYELNIDSKALQYRIPKMSIQPLVENACKHGIQAVEGKGMVKVSALISDGYLRLFVQDNGKGMEPEKLSDLWASIQSENPPGTSTGIRNVYRRLVLYYDDLARFNMLSQPDQGTTLSIELPIRLLVHGDTLNEVKNFEI